MKKYDWNATRVAEAVAKATNYTETLRILEIPTQGRNADTLKKVITENNIDTSHFTGKPKGKKSYISVSEYLSGDRSIKTSKLKEKLIKEGYK